MRVIIFGATGMVGQGVLRECLLDSGVDRVRVVGRSPTGVQHPKLLETVHADSWNYGAIESDLSGFDACFYCLGVTSAGMKEAEYERITYGIAMAAAETLARLNRGVNSPGMTFIFVSGAGADSSERGRLMWARVKGKTENAIMRLPFEAAYAFRPRIIVPVHGARSKTRAYRVLYGMMKPILPMLQRAFPKQVLTTEAIGLAMLQVARTGAKKRVLETADIREVVSRLKRRSEQL